MRVLANAGPLTVQAISGVSVVLLGMDLTEAQSTSLLGFSIRRTDHTEGQRRWLNNLLAFKENDDARTTGYSSLTNPVQTFRWGDYTAKPGHQYTYLVQAQGGTSTALTPLAELELTVSTESADDGEHQILFNRGVIASQLYAHRFGNETTPGRPESGGLSVAVRRSGRGHARLHRSGEQLRMGAASGRLRIQLSPQCYRHSGSPQTPVPTSGSCPMPVGPSDANPKASNAAAITASGLTNCMMPRTHIAIAHNKFIVLLHDGKPVQVWTGSTNVTEGGIFGHANVGHRITDWRVARRYLEYWEQLAANPDRKTIKAFNDPLPLFPNGRPRAHATAVFSARSKLAPLEWYCRLANSAKSAVFLTAAFGLTAEIAPVFDGQRKYLRYLLLDLETGNVETVRRDPSNVVAAGGFKAKGGWRRWIAKGLTNLNGNVDYVHTKFMLVDPLGDDPLVVTGSANWSDESVKANDENMLVIRGDTRVADIYLSEFMRLFNHYEFRAAVSTPRRAAAAQPAASALTRGRRFLDPTADWVKRWYQTGSSRVRERHMFAGTSP